ncbi:MAG: SusC/RagA family TonB-linked outer membrane protein [Prevotella sp.]|jgi:TonB-linked SusC/RagA family outer membrane protein|nr:SusC/RagA family TonB-linked outer membrane protein [Prevotella sp.]
MIKKLVFTLVLCLITHSIILAQNEINLSLRNTSIKELFTDIQKKYGYSFIYSNSDLDDKQTVSLNMENASIQEVLTEVFKNKNIGYEVKGNQIVLKPITSPQQTVLKKISGVVLDSNNEPVIGATIKEVGTTNGTITDIDGKFALSVNERSKINITYVGFQTQTIAVGSKSTFDIILTEDEKVLTEVVVTALGIKREEKALGYAVQGVQGQALQTVRPVDVGTSLTGRVAGLNVLNSTEFGAAPEITLRGENPLIVIDGVPYTNMTLRDLPADDIESMNVLKGATASALYGSKGDGGAIMISTKKGSERQGLSVSVNSGTMFTAGYLAIPEMQSTYGRVVNTATNTYARTGDGSWGVPMEGQEIIQWDPVSKTMKPMPYTARGKDNFKNFLEQGYILNNNISVVQQSQKGSLRASATWVRNKGQYPNSMFNKYTYNLGGEIKLDKFTLSSSMGFNKQTSPNLGFNGYAGYDPMYSLLVWSAPDYDIRDYKDYWLVKNEKQNNSYESTNNNPYFDRYERLHTLNRDIFNGTLALNYDITPWLKATLRTGFDSYSDHQDVRISKGSFTGGGTSTVIKNGTEIWGESAKGSYNMGVGRGYSLNNDLIVSADRSYKDFRFDGFVGGSIFYNQDEGMEARTQSGLTIPGFYSLRASVNPVLTNSRLYRRQVNSIFGRIGASWQSMVYAEATLRNDWSSTLSKSERSYFYPSVAGSFIASELLPEMNWLSFWKLRGSWTTSKKPANIYDINSTYAITQNAWGNLSSATYPTSIRGTEVRAESTSTFEIGTALNFFKGRASLDVAYYNKRMYDFIVQASISPASGYNSNYINSGEEITRKGFEITATVIPVKTKNWEWDITFNWSKYARYYTKLDETFSQDKPWVKVGERVDHYIIREYQKDPDGNIIHSNGLPLYSAYDSKFGNYDPDWIWGMNTGVKYKNWHFRMAMDGRVGGIAQTTTEMYMWRAGSHPNSVVPERYLDATQPGTKNYIGQGVKVVSGQATYDTYGNITSDTRVYAPNDVAATYKTYIENLHKGTAWGGSPSSLDAYSTTFFKIREMSLTYNLPRTLAAKIKAKDIAVSAVGQNMLLWAKDFKYSDPDGGTDNFSDPSQRYIGFNVKIDF